MSIDRDAILNAYIPFNTPIPCGKWEVSPIRLKDWYDVADVVLMLEVDKNTLGQIEFIKMDVLSFFALMFFSDAEKSLKFERLLRLALSIPDDEYIVMDKDANIFVGVPDVETEEGIILNNYTKRQITIEEFEDIRRAILFQNLIDYDDKYVDPDVKRQAEEYWRIKNKGNKSVSLEHKIICVQMKTGMTLEAIGNLTIRNFSQLFDIIAEESEYSALLFAQANGVKFKKPLEHWAFKERKNKYEEAFCDADAFKNKIQNVN